MSSVQAPQLLELLRSGEIAQSISAFMISPVRARMEPALNSAEGDPNMAEKPFRR